ncbi:HNH endonuclease [Patescibacteria group bacterium]|nr:HNH endonuclease [Patescibacteria group bacterium]
MEIISNLPERGLSSKEKKILQAQSRKKAKEIEKQKLRENKTYGDTKVSRRIPEEIRLAVEERDRGRDFGRPNHKCAKPGAPHHILKFEEFLTGREIGNPHSPENLEAPCNECHKLAHELGIPSGESVETFFRRKFNNPKN